MAKRSNNEGSIFKRPNGSWRAQISINGKRKSFSAKTQSECRKWLREIRAQIDQGFNPIGKKPLLKDFLQQWLITVSSSLRPTSVQTYTWILDKYVIPHLGHMLVTDIKPEHVQAMLATGLNQGTSEYMIHKAHKVLHIAFEHALRLQLVHRNPVKGTSPPIPKTREMAFLDENQVQTLLLTAQEIGSQYYPVYFFAINTGMRQGELLGLQWDDLDWERNTLKIHRQLVYRKGGIYEFTKPKTRNGKRTILLGEAALNALRAHQDLQLRQRNAKGNKWQENNLIFPSSIGTPVTPSNLRRSFRKLLKVSGLPKIRFHDLRHTAASLMLNYGIPVLIVSRRLGHAKASITMDVYGHLIPGRQEEAVKLMDEIMTPVSLPVAPALHQNGSDKPTNHQM